MALSCGPPGLPGSKEPAPAQPQVAVMPEAAARESSLTEGGADAAINVLDPVDLIQGLHCILGDTVLQDDSQRVSVRGPPHSCTLTGC